MDNPSSPEPLQGPLISARPKTHSQPLPTESPTCPPNSPLPSRPSTKEKPSSPTQPQGLPKSTQQTTASQSLPTASPFCPPNCSKATASHPILISQEPGFKPLQILPLTPLNKAKLAFFHAGKHHFTYSPRTGLLTYDGRIPYPPIHTRRAKRERLYDLLADYVVHILDEIALRGGFKKYVERKKKEINAMEIPREIRRPVSQLRRTRAGMREWRGLNPALMSDGFLKGLAEELIASQCTCKKCERMRYPDRFSRMRDENVWEMFHLLMDEDCREVRESWDVVFAAHVIGTDGVEDILGYTEFEERWRGRDDKATAWRWLREGEYGDLVAGYDVPDGEGGKGKGKRKEAPCDEKENSHLMVTRKKKKVRFELD
ncbi:uncharacterized protein K444DRAFT_660694 [Hyaloscypha bicolor E]|uniref:Uncharacterized protein n=1 Tax=Hyaloscypha bicolor E TaxID=1095630 RepID=A0A2J6TLX9_9HELO|nr:uncharacterized protein K444DRAFT_660694 [Hyaloscypha bicolor E]PMD64009.1 hypothetical protein K444DRAFT_660694 [Hyaloscypha bicolor E]